jgi:DNA-binding transcriptional MerR regulator
MSSYLQAMDGNGPHSIESLERLTGIPDRTIRAYIARGLLPPPYGRGRASSYGEEHLLRLQFLQAVRQAVPVELPLDTLKSLLERLSPPELARAARGDRAVLSELLGGIDTSLLRKRRIETDAPSSPAPSLRFSMGAPRKNLPASPAGPAPLAERMPPSETSGSDVWSTVDVSADLRISMRGASAEKQSELRRLAARLRAWLTGGSPS